jgi:hypothetical protein
MEGTNGNACVVYVLCGIFFISARRIQNSEFAKNVCITIQITPFQSCITIDVVILTCTYFV